jgi:hypothetical protein
MKNSVHSRVCNLKDTVFKKAGESLLVMVQRERETLLPSIACCSVLLLTLSWMGAIAYNGSFVHFFILYICT